MFPWKTSTCDCWWLVINLPATTFSAASENIPCHLPNCFKPSDGNSSGRGFSAVQHMAWKKRLNNMTRAQRSATCLLRHKIENDCDCRLTEWMSEQFVILNGFNFNYGNSLSRCLERQRQRNGTRPCHVFGVCLAHENWSFDSCSRFLLKPLKSSSAQ